MAKRLAVELFAFVAVLALFACSPGFSAEGDIKLSDAEAKQAQQIAEARIQIVYERQQVQNDYQSALNRLAERESVLNLQSNKLCFQLKKAHEISPNKNYVLDEWRGVLKKQ